MAKPIAGRNKSPFGVSGINVNAAVLADGTKLTNIKISKQRSSNVFDLLSTDGLTTYTYVKISGVDKDGVELSSTDSVDELADKLASGTFCIHVSDPIDNTSGFAVKLLLNKVILQNGDVIFLSDYTSLEEINVTGISVLPQNVFLTVGNTTQINSTIIPSNATNKNITWESSDDTIATVSNGLITGISNGNVVITATTEDGLFSDTVDTTVTTAVQSVSIAPKTINLTSVGETQQLSSTISPASATDKSVTYISSATNVATVSMDGLVTAISDGEAIITVTTTDGSFTDSTTVTVTI